MLLAQIASSVTDLRRTQRWYREVLGLEPAGGTNLFAGPLATLVQGYRSPATEAMIAILRDAATEFTEAEGAIAA